MTHDDEGRKAPEPGAERPEGEAPRDAAAEEREVGRVPAPSPEEAPELLGERSDYPIAWNGEDDQS